MLEIFFLDVFCFAFYTMKECRLTRIRKTARRIKKEKKKMKTKRNGRAANKIVNMWETFMNEKKKSCLKSCNSFELLHSLRSVFVAFERAAFESNARLIHCLFCSIMFWMNNVLYYAFNSCFRGCFAHRMCELIIFNVNLISFNKFKEKMKRITARIHIHFITNQMSIEKWVQANERETWLWRILLISVNQTRNNIESNVDERPII